MSKFFQDFMPGNVCFGCGKENHDGLQIKSFWENDEAVCKWDSEAKYCGWKGIMYGGTIASLIDCHCMATAMAFAYKSENRSIDSLPAYRYATGTITVKYLKPTPNNSVQLRAKIISVKGKKTTIHCDVFSNGVKTAEGEVIAIRVIDSSDNRSENAFTV